MILLTAFIPLLILKPTKLNQHLLYKETIIEISFEEAKTIIKHLCRDLDVPYVLTELQPASTSTAWGEYIFIPKRNSKIRFFGRIKTSTVLHELAHHVHQTRYDNECSVAKAHNITFHRICFEIRDLFNMLYSQDVSDINGKAYDDSKGYFKALDEWFTKRQNGLLA